MSEDTAVKESPFSVPPVTSGYPLEEREREAIERVLRESENDREAEASEKEAA
jgi:hypothetical protein